jgi:hypothetical protein
MMALAVVVMIGLRCKISWGEGAVVLMVVGLCFGGAISSAFSDADCGDNAFLILI